MSNKVFFVGLLFFFVLAFAESVVVSGFFVDEIAWRLMTLIAVSGSVFLLAFNRLKALNDFEA